MTDHTGPDAPIRRPQTCEQKHDATIADILQMANYTSAQAADLMHELEALRARVAALEAQHTTTDEPIFGPWIGTATPYQTYTWLPGDAWSQYTAATDGPGYVHSPGYPQEDGEPEVVRVPVAGDVVWDTGALSWRKQWNARGWQAVTP